MGSHQAKKSMSCNGLERKEKFLQYPLYIYARNITDTKQIWILRRSSEDKVAAVKNEVAEHVSNILNDKENLDVLNRIIYVRKL